MPSRNKKSNKPRPQTDSKKAAAEADAEPFQMDKFKLCITDFTLDLSVTFPEFEHQWKQWQNPELPESEWEKLLAFCKEKYPVRFFDLLYKNEEIFSMVKDVDEDDDDEEPEADVEFLPGVDFMRLYHCPGVSETTKDSIWKYLQMILFLVMKTLRSSSAFGEVEDLFEGVDADSLQEQMKKTLEGLSEFFQKASGETREEGGSEGSGEKTSGEKAPAGERPTGSGPSFGMEGMPEFEELNDHLKSLLGGKIGRFATEIMDEYSKDLEDLMGDVKNMKNVKDMVGNMFKNGKKMKDLLKKIQEKFQAKMDSGEISKEDVMKETKELFGKLKGMKKGKEMNQYMKSMMATMGGLGGMGAGLGKNTRMDLGAMERMIKKEEMAERLRAKAEASRAEREEKAKQESYKLNQTAPNKFSFKVPGEEEAPKSKLERQAEKEKAEKELDDLVNFIEAKPGAGKGKKKSATPAPKA